MPWIKFGEDYHSTNRKTRDRKGGHSPSMLFDEGGVIYVTPTQKRTQKRKKARNLRHRHKQEVRLRIEEMREDIALQAEEMRQLEFEDAWYDDDPMDPEPFFCNEDYLNPWDDEPENDSYDPWAGYGIDDYGYPN